MKLFLLLLALGLLAALFACVAATESLSSPPPQALPDARRSKGDLNRGTGSPSVTPPSPLRYTLTPEKRSRAIAYSRAQTILYFAGVALSLGIYFLLWRGKVAVVIRDGARRVSRRHFVQCLVFVPFFFAAVGALALPLDYYSGFVLEHRFDLSNQTFWSWLGDWGKNLALTVLLGIFVIWVFYWVMRRRPRRWWLYSWLTTIPLTLGLMWVEPYVVEPLFYRFTPLNKTQAALTSRIQAMLAHAGLEIPASRIFEMDASTKTKTLNAYVSGLGASQRVVVWDNTLGRMSEDETLLVLGHEAGHYVLDHALKEFLLIELVVLALFFLGSVAVERLVERMGVKTLLEGVADLASLPVVLFVFTVLAFLSSPIFCGISRHFEHQADQFGLEVAYGVVPDPNGAEARSLQVLGEEDLADPDPNPFIKFWLYTHPPLDDRIRFAVSYKPWAEGEPLKLIHPQGP